MAKQSKLDALTSLLMYLIMSTIIGGMLHCIIFPIGYIIFHDCGKWICDHHYPMTWTAYFIICFFVFLILGVMCIAAESSPSTPSSNSRRNYSSRNNQRHYQSHSSSNLETDYYDSDMEGAPGYYGED